MATYRDGWEDAARYAAALVHSLRWEPAIRKRLDALTSLVLDVAPDRPPPADAEWRAKVPSAVAPSKEPPP